jgi:hypothetical protein
VRIEPPGQRTDEAKRRAFALSELGVFGRSALIDPAADVAEPRSVRAEASAPEARSLPAPPDVGHEPALAMARLEPALSALSSRLQAAPTRNQPQSPRPGMTTVQAATAEAAPVPFLAGPAAVPTLTLATAGPPAGDVEPPAPGVSLETSFADDAPAVTPTALASTRTRLARAAAPVVEEPAPPPVPERPATPVARPASDLSLLATGRNGAIEVVAGSPRMDPGALARLREAMAEIAAEFGESLTGLRVNGELVQPRSSTFGRS